MVFLLCLYFSALVLMVVAYYITKDCTPNVFAVILMAGWPVFLITFVLLVVLDVLFPVDYNHTLLS